MGYHLRVFKEKSFDVVWGMQILIYFIELYLWIHSDILRFIYDFLLTLYIVFIFFCILFLVIHFIANSLLPPNKPFPQSLPQSPLLLCSDGVLPLLNPQVYLQPSTLNLFKARHILAHRGESMQPI